MNFAIVDIETNGKNKITEISIFIYDGEKVIDEFTSLVNPEAYIPPFITNLTGINSQMVEHAPKFYEIAKKVQEITLDTIFVAHAVNFDYNIIRGEFKDLGFDFTRKKLCTVRLSRKILPGHASYSLGNICGDLGITIAARHRARGDAEATVELFSILMKEDTNNIINTFLNVRSREATLPPLLKKEVLDRIPNTTGVYYFINEQKEIIYVGKALDIKQRILSHFYDKARKEITMSLEVADLEFTETGSELVALLLESSEIKRHYPKYNRAQRRARESVGLFSYQDRNGIIHLAFNSLKVVKDPLVKFYNNSSARNFMEKLCEEYELCPKYCHLQSNVGTCFHYQIKECKGICRNEEEVSKYNDRVLDAISSMQFERESFVVFDKGKAANEECYVLIENNIYKGFGYKPKNKNYKHTDYRKKLIPQKDNSDVKRILNSFLNKGELRIESLKIETQSNLSTDLFSFNFND